MDCYVAAVTSVVTVNIRLYGTLVHFVAHLVFQERYSLTTATSCRFLDRANEMRPFRTIVRCWCALWCVLSDHDPPSYMAGCHITGTHITGY